MQGVARQGHRRLLFGLHLNSRRVMATTVAAAQEGWKATKGLKGPGIPAPPGQFRVGCVDFMHHLEGDDRGSLLFRLHYPTLAKPEEGYAYISWYPHDRYIQGYFECEKMKFDPIVLSKITSPKVPALEGAPLISEAGLLAGGGLLDKPTLPVVVFSHGLGVMRTCHSAVACDLASYGYLVACVEHRDGSACVSMQKVPGPGGGKDLQDQWIDHHHVQETEKEFYLRNEQVKIRAHDVKKTLDTLHLLNEGIEMRNMMGGSFSFKQLQGRLELPMTAVMGHSFGSATTILTLAEDRRFKCGIAMDSWMLPLHKDFYQDLTSSVPSPLYFISSHNFQWKENVQRMISLTKPPDSDGMTSCRVLTLKGTHHFNQSDIPFVASGALRRLGIKESELDSAEAHRLNMDICCAFFRRYLLKDPVYQQAVPNLDGTKGHSENIIFGTNVDLSNDDKVVGTGANSNK